MKRTIGAVVLIAFVSAAMPVGASEPPDEDFQEASFSSKPTSGMPKLKGERKLPKIGAKGVVAIGLAALAFAVIYGDDVYNRLVELAGQVGIHLPPLSHTPANTSVPPSAHVPPGPNVQLPEHLKDLAQQLAGHQPGVNNQLPPNQPNAQLPFESPNVIGGGEQQLREMGELFDQHNAQTTNDFNHIVSWLGNHPYVKIGVGVGLPLGLLAWTPSRKAIIGTAKWLNRRRGRK